MTLRNVPTSFTLEQQRQEINTIAVDLDTAVDGVQTFAGEKTFSNNVKFQSKAIWGDDLEIFNYSDFFGSSNFISSDSELIISTNQTNPQDIIIRNGGDNAIFAHTNAAVDLYYNNAKKFETSGTGVTVTGTLAADGVSLAGDISIGDSDQILFGDDADLKMYYDGTVGIETSFIDSDALQIRSESDTSELYATFLKDGPVELYYDGTKKFGTSASGASVLGNLEVNTDITCNSIISNAGGTPTFSIFNTGNAVFEDVEATSLHMKDDRPAHFGTNEDASLYYDNASSDLRLDSEVGFHVRWYDTVNTQYEDQVVFSPFGGTSVYYQGAANPTVDVTNEVRIRGDVEIGDISNGSNLELHAGNNNKLKIFASGNEAYIRNIDNNGGAGGGGLNIAARTTLGLYSGGTGGQYITFVGDSNGAANLYHQTLLKLQTAADGVDITGTLDVSDTLDVVGNTTIGAPDITNSSTGGIQAFSSGQLRIQRDGAGAATDKRFQMYYGTSETASITAGGDATFAGDLTLTDSTKELTAQKIRPVDTTASLTIGGAGLGNIVMESDIVIFDQIGFIGFASAGMNLGAYGTGALNVTNGTGVNGVFRRYEEGTWTPDFLGLSAAFTSYSNKVGNYTRIGDVVHVHGFIQLTAQPSFTTATDHLKIGPLPFNHDTSKNGGYNVTIGGVACQNFNFHDNDYSNTGQVSCGINTDATSGDSYVIFQVSGNNNTRGIVKNSAIGSNDIIEFQLSYQA